MGTKAVYFVFHGALKSTHDKKRNDCRTESDADGDDRYPVNGRREGARLFTADSFGYEIRKVQNYDLTWHRQP